MAKVVLKFEKPNLFDFNKIKLSSIHNASVSVDKSSKTISMTTNGDDPYCSIMGEMQLKPNTSYTFSVECSGGYELYIYRPEYGWTGITNSANTFTTGESGKVGYFRIDSLLGVGQTAIFSNFKLVDNSFKGLEIDDGSIVTLNSLSQSSSDSSSINYGCIANTGSMTIVDFNGNIAKQIKDGIMPSSNVDVDLYVNNNKIQSHITTDSSYDTNTNEFSVSVTNRIADWDILKYKGYIYQNKSATLYEILADVFSMVSDSLDDALSEIITYTYPEDGSYTSRQGTIKEYLQLISIEYPSIEYGYTIRQIIDDICTIAQLQCFIDDNDKLKFVSARPISLEDDEFINIDKSIILEDIDEDLFVKNKYDGVELSETFVNDTIHYATALTQNNIEITENTGLTVYSYDPSSFKYSGDVSALSYIEVEAIYYTGSIDVEKKQNQNLEQILEVFNTIIVNEQYTYSNHYNLYTVPVSGVGKIGRPSVTNNQVAVRNIVIKNYAGVYEYNKTSTLDIDEQCSISSGNLISTSAIKQNNSEITSIIDNGSSYTINYKVLVGKNVMKLTGIGGGISDEDVPMSGTLERYEPISAKISFYGNKRVISFEDISSNSENIDFAKTKASVSLSSKLLQTKTIINGTKLSDIIKHNIIADYKNGLQSAKLKVVCSDMYNQNGDLVKNWQLGKILENNNLVKLDGKVMRINSRDFVYDGATEIEVQALEQNVQYIYGLFKNGEIVYGWNELLSNNLITVENGNITTASTELDGDLFIPNKVKAISENAFYNCSLLTSVSIPDSVEEISSNAFRGCSSLKTAIIPKTIKSIGTGAFVLCNSLESIDFTGTIEDWCRINMESSPMLYAKQLLFLDGNGLKVSSLDVESVNIPTDIQELKYTFTRFYSLKSVVIPNNITKINDGTFSECSSLQSVQMPNALTIISDYAFSECSNLSQISIPASVYKIGGSAFYNCEKLSNINIPSNSVLQTIGSTAFYSTAISQIYLPETVTNIGYSCFLDCKNLTTVNLPSKITNIASSTFSGCLSLTYVYIPYNVSRIGDMAFKGCSSLRSLYLTSNVSYIPNYMNWTFLGCKSLTFYCERTSAYSGWGEGWNCYDDDNMLYCPVKYGYTRSQYESEIGLS